MFHIWVQIGRGCPPSTPRHFWDIFGKSNLSVKMLIFVEKLFLQKSTSYGSSGQSGWGKMLVFWSSLFHLFTSTRQKCVIVREDVCIWHLILWKNDFSFRSFPELILHKNTSTSRRGARPQALFISEKWYLKKIKCVFQLEMSFLDLPPRRPR